MQWKQTVLLSRSADACLATAANRNSHHLDVAVVKNMFTPWYAMECLSMRWKSRRVNFAHELEEYDNHFGWNAN